MTLKTTPSFVLSRMTPCDILISTPQSPVLLAALLDRRFERHDGPLINSGTRRDAMGKGQEEQAARMTVDDAPAFHTSSRLPFAPYLEGMR
jgi:hypothetical protein